MPVRSLNSFVLKWPDAHTVAQAVRRWTKKVVQQRKDIVKLKGGAYADN